jgi:hypothetical protein
MSPNRPIEAPKDPIRNGCFTSKPAKLMLMTLRLWAAADDIAGSRRGRSGGRSLKMLKGAERRHAKKHSFLDFTLPVLFLRL